MRSHGCTQEQAESIVAYWQKALSLLDWEIKVRVVDETAKDGYASVRPHWEWKQATVFLVDMDWNGHFHTDAEHSLIHELLHLHTIPIRRSLDDKEATQCEPEELAINTIAKAFLNLRRENQRLTKALYDMEQEPFPLCDCAAEAAHFDERAKDEADQDAYERSTNPFSRDLFPPAFPSQLRKRLDGMADAIRGPLQPLDLADAVKDLRMHYRVGVDLGFKIG